jgi:D-inositol-3-phosphate glycosyltransferase
MSALQPIALFYDDSAYRETLRPAPTRPGHPRGLMGRQVAGKEFLDAYLEYGQWGELLAVTPNDAAARSLLETCRTHPSSRTRRRKLRHVTESRFYQDFLPAPPVSLIHFPTPPDPRFAWARRAGAPHGFALCGVTHTLCSLRAVEVLRGLIVDPWEPYDRLICTSRAVTRMVRQVMESFGAYLADRHGGRPHSRIGLETIPLGINTERFCPASPSQRRTERQRLGLADDEIAVLFVGRLSHHAKAHPFPMFRGISEAARETATNVRLLLVGWAANDSVLNAFRSAAAEFGPYVRLDILNGLDEKNRFGAWRAADIFCSLSDNIQETFGLVIVEAMASGLPVVATDWNGYRDLVVDGETGLLIPTHMIPGGSNDLTSQLFFGSLDYDHFLARSSQSVVVDTTAVAAAFVRLFRDRELRDRLGAAGRRRAAEEFAWQKIIQRYEAVWEEQQTLLASSRSSQGFQKIPGNWREDMQRPEAYPPLETTFEGYPTSWLDDAALLQTAPAAAARLAAVMNHRLTGYESHQRCTDAASLHRVLDAATEPSPLSKLVEVFRQDGLSERPARATLAWLLKYDVLRLAAQFPQES